MDMHDTPDALVYGRIETRSGARRHAVPDECVLNAAAAGTWRKR